MRRLQLFLLISGMVVGGVGCLDRSKTDTSGSMYDIQPFIQEEIHRLDSLQPSVRKVALIGGEKEQQRVDSIDWATELRAFTNLDLSRPAWSDSYRIDTLESYPLKVHYQAREEGLKIREVTLTFQRVENRQIPKIIEARLKSDNLLFTSTQNLYYHRNRSYRIEGHQDIMLAGENHFRIRGTIIGL